MSLPVTGVPAKRSGIKDLKIRRRLVFGGLILAALLGLLSTFAWLTQPKPEPVKEQPTINQIWADASITAQQWLSGAPLTMAVAQGVDVAGVTREPLKYKELTPSGFSNQNVPQGLDNPSLQALNVLYTVNLYTEEKDPQNTDIILQIPHYYTLTVPMIYDASGKTAVLGALPSIQPVTPLSGQGFTPAKYVDVQLDSLDNASAIETAITSWAEVWAKSSNDPAGVVDPAFNSDLKRLTGDPDPNRFYLGLGGWTAENVTIGGGTTANLAEYGGGILFNISLELTNPGGVKTTSNYDVWVQDEGEANPKIVAWAASPGYTEILPYYNGFIVGQ